MLDLKTYDNVDLKLVDGLRESIRKSGRLAIAGAVFSIYAYEALREELSGVEELRFLYTSPTFSSDKATKASREFFIPQLGRERALFGTAFEIKLRNQLTQRAIARECANWIRRSARFRTSLMDGAMVGEAICGRGDEALQFFPVQDFTTTALGLERGAAYATQILRLSAPNATVALATFDSVWNDPSKVRDVTEEVLENIETLYRENSPEFLYYVTLSNVFSRFLEDLTEDVLPNEDTGFRKSLIWHKLYNFQKDAAFALIQKLEKYNGCILADSVGLGKTFTALAVIKYYESRNQRVLVLCPKKLNNNWTTWKNNYTTNVLAGDRFRYDVLYHSDLSRRKGESNGLDLSLINWGNYDLVVIDESHNFRNGYSTKANYENRYERLMTRIIREGVKTKVLMLSATPVNNRFSDLKNQLQLAYEGKIEEMDERLEVRNGIDETFRQAQGAYNEWTKRPPEERTAKALQEALPFDFFEILDAVTIARSRRHIERYYDTTDIGRFPKRLAPLSRSPKLTDQPGAPDYEEIFELLRQLNLAVYTPSSFILPSRVSVYAQMGGARGLSLEGRELGIRQLMSVNLLKRLESSVNSFRLTLERVRDQICVWLDRIKEAGYAERSGLRVTTALEPDGTIEADEAEALEETLTVATKSMTIALSDMDCVLWSEYLRQDLELLDQLLSRIANITPEHDGKLQQLKADLATKIARPINSGNKKVILFTAFADTAQYLYDHIAPFMLANFGLHTALVTGQIDSRTTLKTKTKLDFNTTLTLFSPRSKEKAVACPQVEGEIDLLIATDCISEGQNLQDCDYLINFDIHWNPVRIIQRFGRIDRIGSANEVIQLVNYWPDIELDEYIDLKARVEARMKVSVLTSTGDENPLSPEEQNDIHFREQQLKRLQHEILDLEDMNSGISIMDLGLTEFRMDLLAYMKEHPETERAPHGLHAVLRSDDESPEGAIFVLRSIKEDEPLDVRNRIHPFYMVYVDATGETVVNHLDPKTLLDRLRHLAKGRSAPDEVLCRAFNKETRDGSRMGPYSDLLNRAVSAIGEGREKSTLDAFLEGDDEPIFGREQSTVSDFELISFFVVKRGE